VDSLIVFDMDGVLTEVSESYREAIVQTVAHFTGRTITRDLIQQYKNRGGWNNDWALSQQIASDFGVEIAYEDVIAQFNRLFLGAHADGEGAGLIARETWCPESGLLGRLHARGGIAIFTGRLRKEADITLRRFAPELAFDPIICSDDVVRGKPAPDGLHEIQKRHPKRNLIFVGDTVDDARSSSAAEVPFIGIAARNHSRREDLVGLFEAERAIAILENINEIESVL
jgi:HAD superfamily phosphatase